MIHIQSLIVSQAIGKPVVDVRWTAGPADVTRSLTGEVLWEREPTRWSVSLRDEAKFYALMATPEHGAEWTKGTEEISGLRFRALGKPDNPALFGCTIDFVAEKLIVREVSERLSFPRVKNHEDHLFHSLPDRSIPARSLSRLCRKLGAYHPALRWPVAWIFPAVRRHQRYRLGPDRLRQPRGI